MRKLLTAAVLAIAAVGIGSPARAGTPSLASPLPATGGQYSRSSYGLVPGIDRPGDSGAINHALSTQRRLHPGGVVSGRTITYADGTVFIAVAPDRNSRALCSDERFCSFSQEFLRGSVLQYGRLGSRVQYSWAGSYYNARSRRTDVWSTSGQHRHRLMPGDEIDQLGPGFHSDVNIVLRGF